MKKQLILGIVIGLALTSGVAFAWNEAISYKLKALDPLEVPTQQIFSKQIDTSIGSIYKFTDGPVTCYVNILTGVGQRTMSCVR